MPQPQEAIPVTESALVAALRTALANTYTLYFHAHAAHWNVEGPRFVSLHAFFGDLYASTFGAVDMLAEALRQHSVYGPATFAYALSFATLPDEAADPWNDEDALLGHLGGQNAAIMDSYAAVMHAAEAAGDFGLSNLMQDRLAYHRKVDWQIRALLA